MRKFLRYLVLPIYRSIVSMNDLIEDDKRLNFGASILLFVAVLYTITVAIAARKGIHVVVKPFLNIPPESYYRWEVFFTIPVFFLTVIVFSGFARFFAELLGGKGDFETIFAVYSVVIVLPLILTMWIPETLLILLKEPHSLNPHVIIPAVIDIPRQVIGVLWPLVYTVIAIKRIEGFGLAKSLLISLLAFVPYTVLILVFIR